jgi:hypothetical protein
VFSFRVHLTEPPTQVAVPPLDAIEILDWAAENSGDLEVLMGNDRWVKQWRPRG